MSRAVLISIRPKWCEKIANGEKAIEVRKTRPKMETPFKCYIYCTQSADMLWILKERERFLHPDKIADVFKAAKCGGAYRGNGKVIGEFVCDRIYDIVPNGCEYIVPSTDKGTTNEIAKQSCLTFNEVRRYLGLHCGYGWHTSNLKFYDEPKKLSEFTGLRKTKFGMEPVTITRPPQSWGYVEELP